MHELVLREDRQGPMNRAHKFLQMKNFAEAAYDECIMRRADDPGLSAGLRLEDGLCGLTRIDVLEGMRIFTKTLGR